MSNDFRDHVTNVANANRDLGLGLDVYALLALADWLVDRSINFGPVNPINPVTGRASVPHESLVAMAQNLPRVHEAIRDGKKINAIKELRSACLCGLKEAKDAIEDARVWDRFMW